MPNCSPSHAFASCLAGLTCPGALWAGMAIPLSAHSQITVVSREPATDMSFLMKGFTPGLSKQCWVEKRCLDRHHSTVSFPCVAGQVEMNVMGKTKTNNLEKSLFRLKNNNNAVIISLIVHADKG